MQTSTQTSQSSSSYKSRWHFVTIIVALGALATPTLATEDPKPIVYQESTHGSALPKALSQDVIKAAIPYDPFELRDPTNGQLITPDTKIFAPGATPGSTQVVTAGDFYRTINDLQRDLNAVGFSLKNAKDEAIISRIVADRELLKKQLTAIAMSKLPFDEQTMKVLQDPKKLAHSMIEKAQDTANIELQKMYTEALNGSGTPFQIELKALDPETVKKPSADLKNIVNKTWSIEEGEKSKFAITAAAQLNLSGSVKKVDALADAQVNLFVFSQDFNVAYAGVQTVLDRSSGTIASNLSWHLQLLGNTIYDDHVASATDIPVVKTRGDVSSLIPPFRTSAKFTFPIGPIPVSGEVGACGEFNTDWTIGHEGWTSHASADLIPKVEAFASLTVDIIVAEAGVRSNLVIWSDDLKVQGTVGPTIDPVTGDGQITVDVRGTSHSVIMKGSISAYAAIPVPAMSLPPWKMQPYEKVLYEFAGLADGQETTIFNFGKVVTTNGYFLKGAPRPEDCTEIDVENALNKSLQDAMNLLRDNATNDSLARATASANVVTTLTGEVGALKTSLRP